MGAPYIYTYRYTAKEIVIITSSNRVVVRGGTIYRGSIMVV